MILDFGSINMDLVMAVTALPRPGETVLCDGYVTKPGGKGSNQAVAAARAGAQVAMAGAVGDDGFGQVMRATLAKEGIDTSLIATSDRPTGVAYICVDAKAENFIAVGSGANLAVRADQVPDDRLTPDTLLVLQMELPPEQNWALLQRARARGCRAILNVAPAAAVPEAALRDLDLLVVNEHEALAIAGGLGLDTSSPRAAAQALSGRMSLTCVVTLGGEGAIAVGPGRASPCRRCRSSRSTPPAPATPSPACWRPGSMPGCRSTRRCAGPRPAPPWPASPSARRKACRPPRRSTPPCRGWARPRRSAVNPPHPPGPSGPGPSLSPRRGLKRRPPFTSPWGEVEIAQRFRVRGEQADPPGRRSTSLPARS